MERLGRFGTIMAMGVHCTLLLLNELRPVALVSHTELALSLFETLLLQSIQLVQSLSNPNYTEHMCGYPCFFEFHGTLHHRIHCDFLSCYLQRRAPIERKSFHLKTLCELQI